MRQPRAGTAGPVQDDKHLAALRRDLDAEAGKSGIPVNNISLGVGSASMAFFVSLMRGMKQHLEGAT